MKRRVSQLVIWLVGYFVIGTINMPQAFALEACTPKSELSSEPHPLRPDDLRVCTDDLPDTVPLSCGTDMVVAVKRRMQRADLRGDAACTPEGGSPGDPITKGKNVTCTRKNQLVSVPFSIDLKDLELPIAGVASNTAVSDTTPDFLRMRNYTSWYLQGALEQADEEPLEGRLVAGGLLPVRGNPRATEPLPTPPASGTLLALGDSITEGVSSEPYKPYPCYLAGELPAFSLVGGQEATTFCPGIRHEGHGGFKTNDILAKVQSEDLPRRYNPNVVLIHLGTNDVGFIEDFQPTDTVNNIQAIVDAFYNHDKNAAIFVAKIIPNKTDWNFGERAEIVALNTLIEQSIAGAYIVDLFNPINPSTDLWDAVHPNDQGSQTIAETFANAVLNPPIGGTPTPAPSGAPTPAAARPMTFDDYIFALGPLKKLVPDVVFTKKREELIAAAASGRTYNQIIGYVDKATNKVAGRKTALAYFVANPTGIAIEKIRLDDMAGHIDPPYDPTNQDAMKWYALWRQTPFVQAADLAGEVFATVGSSDPDVTQADLTISSPTTVDALRVRFPHVQEDNQLAEFLQDVFIPQGVDRVDPSHEDATTVTGRSPSGYDYSTVDRDNPWPGATSYCRPENLQTPWNPGDNLGSTTVIQGQFSFRKDVTYTYREPTDPELIAAGIKRPTTEEVEVSAPISIFARSPQQLHDLYDRLVNGPGGVYKALMPVLEPIEDWPAAAALSGECGANCEVWPGNEEDRKLELFFPHLGSVLRNFHENLQCALDPLGRCTHWTPSGP